MASGGRTQLVQPSLFTPVFGHRPHRVAGRRSELADLEASVLQAPRHSNSSNLILGQRGFGKTVLLNEIEDIASSEGWVVLRVDAISPGVAQRILVEAAKHPFAQEMLSDTRSADVTETSRSVSRSLLLRWASLSERKSETRAGPSVRDTLEMLGRAAEEQGTGVLLTVDELHAGEHHEMVRLAADLQHVVARQEMPVAFVGAALPEVLCCMLRDPRLSFFRRCDQYTIGAVSDEEARLFFEQGISDGGGTITAEARELLVRHADGYPYKMQLLGHWAWRHADAPFADIDVADADFAETQASSFIRDRVHAHIWLNISHNERALVRAVADHQSEHGSDASLWDVSHALPYSPEAITDMLARLNAVGALHYDHGTHVRLGPLMDTEYVAAATSALRAMEQSGSVTGTAAHNATTGQARRPRCNTLMKTVPGRCIRPAQHSGRCRSK